MAAQVAELQRKLKHFFGEDCLSWFDRSYVVDWAIATVGWVIVGVLKEMPPFERDFDRKDPIIDFKHKKNQISGSTNWLIAFLVPLGVAGLIGCLRRSALEIHHGALAVYAGRVSTGLITEFLKNRVGRLRPDFLARCKWDKDLKACTGNIDDIIDGRRSFPSGHSSTAWAGMTFLSLYLAGMTGAWCFNHPAPGGSFFASRLARLIITLAPLLFATWVAVSRIEDNRHHKEDVIVGSLIGLSSSTVCYLIYWPNPFTQASRGKPSSRARLVYADDSDRQDRYGYELAGMEHANGGTEPV